jgi:hypothetical protein
MNEQAAGEQQPEGQPATGQAAEDQVAAAPTRTYWALPAAPQAPAPQPAAVPPTAAQPVYPPPGYPPAGYPPAYPQPTGTYPASQAPPPAAPAGGVPGGLPGGMPPRQPPRRHDGNRPGSSRALWILLPLLLLGIVAAVLLTHPFRHSAQRPAASAGTGAAASAGSTASAGSGGTTSASPVTSGSPAAPSPSASAATERQGAAGVASMLAQSVSDRSAIASAAADVAGCGPDLARDPKVFDDAVRSRQALLARLSTLTGRSALPAALVSDLTQAWRASISADQAYARWATDEISKGCVVNDTSDPGYQATVTPNTDATREKTAFTAQWNPVAARYGLTRYQPGEL